MLPVLFLMIVCAFFDWNFEWGKPILAIFLEISDSISFKLDKRSRDFGLELIWRKSEQTTLIRMADVNDELLAQFQVTLQFYINYMKSFNDFTL